MSKQQYEILTRVDFGTLAPAPNGEQREDKRDAKGVYEPTPEGQPNPTVSLDEKAAAPLLEAGAIRPAGVEGFHATDSPEEHGYQGEEVRNKAMKTDEVYTKSSSKASGKSKG